MNPTYILRGVITAQQPLATCGPALSKSVKKTDPKPVPTMNCDGKSFMFMPGSGIRSKLRGALLGRVRQALRESTNNPTPLSLDDHAVLRIGGVKQGGVEIAATAQEMAQMRATNPLISLFGAATPWVTGKLHVGSAVDKDEVTGAHFPVTIDGVRMDPIRRDPEAVEFIDPASMGAYQVTLQKIKDNAGRKKKVKDLTEEANAALRANDKDTTKALRAKIAALEKEIKDKKNAVVSAQLPLGGYKAIPASSRLKQDIRLMNGTNIELGALIAALDAFSATPLIGGHVAHGCGEVSGEWTVTEVAVVDGRTTRKQIGTVTLTPFEGIEVTGDVLPAARDEFEVFLRSPNNMPCINPEWLKAAKEAEAEEEADETAE